MKSAGRRVVSLLLVATIFISVFVPNVFAIENSLFVSKKIEESVGTINVTSQYTWVDNDRFIEYPVSKTACDVKVIDGNTATLLEAEALIVSTEEPEYIAGIEYTTRQDNNYINVMTDYTIYTSEDGAAYTEAAKGTLLPRLGTTFIAFDNPVLAKYVKIVPTVKQAVSELRLLYIPKGYKELLAEADAVRAQTEAGTEAGYWDANLLESFDENLAGMKENENPVFADCQALFELISRLKRKQMEDTTELNGKFVQAQTFWNAAVAGTEPYNWSQESIDEFKTILDKVESVVQNGQVADKGSVQDSFKELEEGLFLFKKAQVRPSITLHSPNHKVQIGTDESIMDGIMESRMTFVSGSGVAAQKGTRYIELDYGKEMQFESLTFYSWFCMDQAISQLAVDVKSESGDWVSVDEGKEWTLTWGGNNQKPSEKAALTFSNPVKGTALRIHMLKGGKNRLNIDELEVGIGVAEENINISLDKTTLEIEENQTSQLNAMVLPSYAPNKNVRWISSQPDVVSVTDEGLVKGLALPEGESSHEVTITAQTEYGGKTAACKVTLLPKKANEEDTKDTIRRVEILRKLANASKEADYAESALAAFKAEITEMEEALQKDSFTIGDLRRIDKRCKEAEKALEEKSLIPIRTIGELIDRVTGTGSKDNFIIEVIPADSETGMDVYEVDWNENESKVVLRGNNGVALATAYNYYLKYFAYLDFPFVGDSTLVLPDPLPRVDEPVHIVFPYEYRHYFNPNCEYKYCTNLYGEEEWTHRLDWMAMNGINMFLLDIGEKAIWYNVLDEMGLQDNSAAIQELFASNPGVEQFWGEHALSEDAILYEGEIAKFITQRAFDLGMEPEIYPFVGMVPFMFPNNRDNYYNKNLSAAEAKKEFVVSLPGSMWDGVTVYPAARWTNLPKGVFISPEVVPGSSDEAAEKARATYNKARDLYYASMFEIFGFDEYGRTPKYANKDIVDESGFIIQHAAFPQRIVGELNDDLQAINPDAVWLQSSWRYQSWVNQYYDPGELLIFDLYADYAPKWKGNEFSGTPWLWTMLYNFGGNTGMGGGLDGLAKDVTSAASTAHYMKGIGIAPEGGDTNPVLYALMAEMGWRAEAPDINQWIQNYAKRRYGAENYMLASEEINNLWELLLETVYCKSTDHAPTQTYVVARPNPKTAGARLGWSFTAAYNRQDIFAVWKAMLDAADAITAAGGTLNEQFMYDMVDLTRQALADFSEVIYMNLRNRYNAGDYQGALLYAQRMVTLCEKMDEILATNRFFTLGSRLEAAKARGTTESDIAFFEQLERTFSTYWILDDYDAAARANLIDYCNRHLSGLMTDYYGMRWQKLCDELERAINNGDTYRQSNVDQAVKPVVISWSKDRTPYPADANGENPVEVSKELFAYYLPLFQEMYLDGGALRDLYEENVDRVNDDYDTAAWERFAAARENAKSVLESALTKDALDQSRGELEDAIDALVVSLEAPTFEESVQKLTKDATAVDFVLKNSNENVSYKLYASEIGGDVLADPVLAVADGKLTVTFTTLPTETKEYFVSAARESRNESTRTKITVVPHETGEDGKISGSVMITGIPKFGETLTADTGLVLPAGAVLEYQWYRNDVPIDGAVQNTVTMTADDIGATITVTVTGTGDNSGSLTSAPTNAVEKADGPSAPDSGVFQITDESSDGTADGSIAGITVDMEWSSDNGSSWNSGTGELITGLLPADYQVRYKETATHRASDWATVTVKAADAVYYNVSYALNNLIGTGPTVIQDNNSLNITLKEMAGYRLPDSITVTMNGNVLTDGYTYDSSTGAVTIGAVVGDITIAAEGVQQIEMLPHTISVNVTGAGSVTPNKSSAVAGETITLNVTADADNSLKSLAVTTESGTEVGLTENYAFVMPDENVAVTAEFALNMGQSYTVTVNGGTGGGEFAVGDEIEVTANPPASEKTFSHWEVQGIKLPDNTVSTVKFVMPSNDVTLTARYKDVDREYVVTVNGSEIGNYAVGTSVTVSAPSAPLGEQFTRWLTKGITLTGEDSIASTITFVMPRNDVELTALFEKIPPIETAVEGVSVECSEMVLKPNETSYIKAIVYPDNASNKNVTFTSSDEAVVKVDETGKITALKTGVAVVTVTTQDGGFTAICKVEVKDESSSSSSGSEGTGSSSQPTGSSSQPTLPTTSDSSSPDNTSSVGVQTGDATPILLLILILSLSICGMIAIIVYKKYKENL